MTGQRVYVYRNLHANTFSIRAASGPNRGRVIARADLVNLDRVEFRVNQGGRQRVLNEGRKNVHAFAIGWWNPDEAWPTERSDRIAASGAPVSYNPYTMERFQSEGREILQAAKATLRIEDGKAKVYAL